MSEQERCPGCGARALPPFEYDDGPAYECGTGTGECEDGMFSDRCNRRQGEQLRRRLSNAVAAARRARARVRELEAEVATRKQAFAEMNGLREEELAKKINVEVELAQLHRKIELDAFAKGDTQAIRLISEKAIALEAENKALRMELDMRQAPSIALADVLTERVRQEKKWGEQNHDPFTYLTILVEEVGEFAQAALHALFGGHAAPKLREEAIHSAAVALAIVECLDRGKWKWPCLVKEGE